MKIMRKIMWDRITIHTKKKIDQKTKNKIRKIVWEREAEMDKKY